jgi:hypothetical protein
MTPVISEGEPDPAPRQSEKRFLVGGTEVFISGSGGNKVGLGIERQGDACSDNSPDNTPGDAEIISVTKPIGEIIEKVLRRNRLFKRQQSPDETLDSPAMPQN